MNTNCDYLRVRGSGFGFPKNLKKLRRAEGGAKIVGVFRVKNHAFTAKNHIFSNFRGGGHLITTQVTLMIQL